MKHYNVFMLSLLTIFQTTSPKVHIIEPLTRSTTKPEHDIKELLQKINSSTYKNILINISDRHAALSFLPHLQTLKKQNKTITVKVPEELNTLLSWCPYIDQIFSSLTEYAYDIEIDIEDLAIHQETTKQVKNKQPLLMIDETIHALWQEQFIQDTNYKVGVFCQPLNTTTQKKSTIEIKDFYPLACMQDISMYTCDTFKIIDVPDHIHIHTFSHRTKKSLPDIAAILHHLDVVITNQPFIAHFAAALNKQVWFIASENSSELSSQYNNIETFEQTNDRNVIFDIMHHLACNMQKPIAQIVTAEVPTGELIDKMTILEIKTERIKDEKKLENIWRELRSLRKTFDTTIAQTPELEQLIQELKSANEALWTTEDLIRDKEREKSFDNEFILLARSVYIQNDERCRAKREINELLGSRLMEEKSYKPYN